MDIPIAATLFAVGLLVSWFDLRERRAPDLLTLGGLALVLVLRLPGGWATLAPGLSGAALGLAPLLLARALTKGGLGAGDIKFGAFLGAALGPRELLVCLLAAALLGLAFAGISYKLGRFHRGTAIPFAPFLAAGALLALAAEGFTHYSQS